MLSHQRNKIPNYVHGREGREEKLQIKGRNKPAAKLGKIHEHNICSPCLQRPTKLPLRNTLLLAWYLIYLPARNLLRWRTPTAFNPCIDSQCYWPKHLQVHRAREWPWPPPGILLSGIPGSDRDPWVWPWVSGGHGNWWENMSSSQRRRRATWILHYWCFQSEYCVTVVLQETVWKGIMHQQLPQPSTTGSLR